MGGGKTLINNRLIEAIELICLRLSVKSNEGV